MENHESRKQSLGGCVIGAAICFVALVFYPLSGGPAVALFKAMNWSPWIIQSVYGPVFSALEICPPLGRAYTWYWNWWAA
jgi:hypothetical protein